MGTYGSIRICNRCGYSIRSVAWKVYACRIGGCGGKMHTPDHYDRPRNKWKMGEFW